MHIAINISNGIPYATVMTSVREGKTVKKKSVVYLGRVLDEERGIYKSAERGVFFLRPSHQHVWPSSG